MKEFSKDPQLTKWMRSLLGLLITEVDTGVSTPFMERVWEVVQDSRTNYQRYPGRGPGQTDPELTLEMCQARGGEVFSRSTPSGGLATFARLEGVEYYVATNSGKLWRTDSPPPGLCVKCKVGKHWGWQCTAGSAGGVGGATSSP